MIVQMQQKVALAVLLPAETIACIVPLDRPLLTGLHGGRVERSSSYSNPNGLPNLKEEPKMRHGGAILSASSPFSQRVGRS